MGTGSNVPSWNWTLFGLLVPLADLKELPAAVPSKELPLVVEAGIDSWSVSVSNLSLVPFLDPFPEEGTLFVLKVSLE